MIFTDFMENRVQQKKAKLDCFKTNKTGKHDNKEGCSRS